MILYGCKIVYIICVRRAVNNNVRQPLIPHPMRTAVTARYLQPNSVCIRYCCVHYCYYLYSRYRNRFEILTIPLYTTMY